MSKSKILLLAFLFAMSNELSAQEHLVQGVTPDLYLSHQVAAKETWYSIGRMYNLAPKEIAAYNKLNPSTPLEIGQPVKVPLLAANFSQNEVKNGGEAFVPVYHLVQPKEWLYRISVNYNKVPVANLEKWNALGKDGAKPGTKLIVGYLKVKDGNAALASAATGKAPEKAVVAKPAPSQNDSGVPRPAPAAEKKQEAEPVAVARPAEAEPAPVSSSQGGSYFKNMFDDKGKSTSGVTGIFKSTSGWKDGKYYALVNSVPVGTIIKVSYPSTNKSIYAKVLGELPDMKESAGLSLRISDAAAYELGSPESKFSVDVQY